MQIQRIDNTQNKCQKPSFQAIPLSRVIGRKNNTPVDVLILSINSRDSHALEKLSNLIEKNETNIASFNFLSACENGKEKLLEMLQTASKMGTKPNYDRGVLMAIKDSKIVGLLDYKLHGDLLIENFAVEKSSSKSIVTKGLLSELFNLVHTTNLGPKQNAKLSPRFKDNSYLLDVYMYGNENGVKAFRSLGFSKKGIHPGDIEANKVTMMAEKLQSKSIEMLEKVNLLKSKLKREEVDIATLVDLS